MSDRKPSGRIPPGKNDIWTIVYIVLAITSPAIILLTYAVCLGLGRWFVNWQ